MKKKGTNELKCFELIITLPKTGKSYYAVVPAKTSDKIIRSLGSIVYYIRKYGVVDFNLNEMK